VGVAVISHSAAALIERPLLASLPFYLPVILLGLLLLIGLWTPIVGVLVAVSVVWEVFAHSATWEHCLPVAVMAVALSLLGPGAWSVDARLYGWKQITISGRNRDREPPA